MTPPLYITNRSSYTAKIWWPHPFKTYPGPWKPPAPEGPLLIDSFPIEEQNDNRSYGVYENPTMPQYNMLGASQTLRGKGAKIGSVKISLNPSISPAPTGHAVVNIFSTQGVIPGAAPAGAPLAISDPLDVSMLTPQSDPRAGVLYEFKFTGANQIVLNAGTVYAIAFQEQSGGTFGSGAFIYCGLKFALQGYDGNAGYDQGGWDVDDMADMVFYLYAAP